MPDKYTQIITMISEGASLRKACKAVKMGHGTFYEWLNDEKKGKERQTQYARACEERATALVEEMLEIADDGTNDTYTDDKGNVRTDWDVLGRSKLRVDTRKWIASKLKPKKYGDSTQIKLTDDDGGPAKLLIQYVGNNKDNNSGSED